MRLSAPTPSRRRPVGCESSPQPHRRPPAGAQHSRGVSGRRRRARGSPPPPVGLSRNSGNPQTRETYELAGVTSPATPGSLSTILGLVPLPGPTPRQASIAAWSRLTASCTHWKAGPPRDCFLPNLKASIYSHQGWVVKVRRPRRGQSQTLPSGEGHLSHVPLEA